LGQLDVVKLATPHLAQLLDELNETCFLAKAKRLREVARQI
jgi:DNA-binding IclR family transcriptional regulator